jgi:methionyl-tRNA synthetase
MMYLADSGWQNWLIALAVLWTIPWKGLALWKAARRGETGWFFALLIVNTLGVLEILYIFVFSKRQPEVVAPVRPPQASA